jgi:uncharacterized Ntn-hydrolase superfamily protein
MRSYFFLFLFYSGLVNAQTPYGSEPLAHTYSIVAIDENTGEMGVAVQSHWFSVGTIVAWGEAGVGVIATQSFVNPALGADGLKLMKLGFSAEEALNSLVSKDKGESVRQVAFLDKKGNASAHTGSDCIAAAGHYVGNGFSVQANMMEKESVWPAMADAFENSKGEALEERLMRALEAAEKEGGDIRGRQSIAILIVKAESTGQPWLDRKVDLRLDDHPEPLKEMRRLLKVHKAYGHMNAGDLAVEHGDFKQAMEEYKSAEELFPDNLEMKYWHAVTLSNIGKVDEALPLFKDVFEKNDNWRKLTTRLVPNNLLTVSESDLQRILKL